MSTLKPTTNAQPSLEELLTFPCEFKIKIMGLNVNELISEVCAIINQHSEDFVPSRDLTSKLSSKGNYLALTVTVQATSKAQLDNIYLTLNNHPLVKITL
jgi:hypothetical protein